MHVGSEEGLTARASGQIQFRIMIDNKRSNQQR